MENLKDYYQGHSPMTAPGAAREEIKSLPKEISALCTIVQGLLIHRELAAWLYDVRLSEEQRDLANLRPLGAMAEKILTIDAGPLTVARDPAHRMPSVCRHFSTMLCATLREHGVPARARCGFGSYFNPGRFEDHWVCEYWNADQSRWVLVDAQLDPIQRKMFRLDFDPTDVPRDRFIIAGDAWQRCRGGRADAERFGLSLVNLQGLWFIAGNVLRDLASLSGMEMLPWDVWGMMSMDNAGLSEDKRTLLDRIAALTLGADNEVAQAREVYRSDDKLRVPGVVFNAMRQRAEQVGV